MARFLSLVLPIFLFQCSLVFSQDSVAAKFDFDEGRKLSSYFRASGKIALAAKEAPDPESANDEGVGGRALKVNSEGNFAFYTVSEKPLIVVPEVDTIRLRIFNAKGGKQRFDFIAIEPDRKAMFWRKVEFEHEGWGRIDLPMRWFRWNRGRAPLWNQVVSVGVRGGEGIDCWLDGIELLDLEPDVTAELTSAEVEKAMFPGSVNVRAKTEENVWVITDSDELDLETLHSHLVSVHDRLAEMFPMWDLDAGRPPMMVVAKDLDTYRSIFERLGEKYVATIPVSSSGGYHIQGIGFSTYDPKQGALRPVFTHEFTHSFASSVGRVDFAGRDWFQEGLASLIQTSTHPQKGLGILILTSIRSEDSKDPLEELTSGEPITSRRYWQAMTLVDYLMNGPEMKEKFPAFLEAIDQSGTTNLSKHLESVWGLTFSELEESWEAYVRDNLHRFDSGMRNSSDSP